MGGGERERPKDGRNGRRVDGVMGGCGWGAGMGVGIESLLPQISCLTVFLRNPAEHSGNASFALLYSLILVFSLHQSDPMHCALRVSSVQLSSVQQGIDPLGKTHMRYLTSLKGCFSFPVLFWKHFITMCVNITVYKKTKKGLANDLRKVMQTALVIP